MHSNSLKVFDNLPITLEPIPKNNIEIQPNTDFLQPTPPANNENAASYTGQRCSLLPSQKIDALRQTFERHQNERQLVILQDFPDPDALSCAWTYQLIAEQYDIQCDIVYAGTLSHQENIALVKLTGLPAQRWTLQKGN